MRKTLFWYFCADSGLKRPQNEFYQVLPKINSPNFSDFLHEARVAWRFKSELNDFLVKFLVWAKFAQNKVFKCEKSTHITFLHEVKTA